MPLTLPLLFALAASAFQDEGSTSVFYGSLADVRRCHRAAESRDSSDASRDSCSAAIESRGISERNRRACFANRGVLHYLRGDYPAARDDFSAALELEGGESAPILTNRGLAYEQLALGDPNIEAFAAADYRAALEEDPDLALARARLEQLNLPYPQRRKLRRVNLASLPQAAPHDAAAPKVTL